MHLLQFAFPRRGGRREFYKALSDTASDKKRQSLPVSGFDAILEKSPETRRKCGRHRQKSPRICFELEGRALQIRVWCHRESNDCLDSLCRLSGLPGTWYCFKALIGGLGSLEDCETRAYISFMLERHLLPVAPVLVAWIPSAFGQLPKRLAKCLPYLTLAQEIRDMQPAPTRVRVHVIRVDFDSNDGIPADASREISEELRSDVFEPDAEVPILRIWPTRLSRSA